MRKILLFILFLLCPISILPRDVIVGDNYTTEITVLNEELRGLEISNQIKKAGKLNVLNKSIENVSAPVNATDAATKGYVDGLLFTDRGDPAAADLTSPIIDSAYHDWDLSSIVPAGAKAVLLFFTATSNTAGVSCFLRKNGNSNNNNNIGGIIAQVATVPMRGDVIIPCDANRVIEYYFQNDGVWSEIGITVKGWWK